MAPGGMSAPDPGLRPLPWLGRVQAAGRFVRRHPLAITAGLGLVSGTLPAALVTYGGAKAAAKIGGLPLRVVKRRVGPALGQATEAINRRKLELQNSENLAAAAPSPLDPSVPGTGAAPAWAMPSSG